MSLEAPSRKAIPFIPLCRSELCAKGSPGKPQPLAPTLLSSSSRPPCTLGWGGSCFYRSGVALGAGADTGEKEHAQNDSSPKG